MDAEEQARGIRLQARVDAIRGDSTGLHALRGAVPLVSTYPWALFALAQREAARGASTASKNVDAAIAAASAEVISARWPSLRPQAQARLDAELRGRPDTSGVALGRRAAQAWMATLAGARRALDTSDYVGPMGWRSLPGRDPDGQDLALSAPFVLAHADQFRPAPPPVPGSKAFAEALAEVRRAAEQRTSAQRRVARYWALRNGITEWARRAAHLLAREEIGDPEAVTVLARLQVALADATIACFEAKYHYGLLRPEHVDSTITRPWAVSLPNFPAYPAGHGCTAGAAETVLIDAIPAARNEIREAAAEMTDSRLWAGVHYRFDNEEGRALGRAVARFVLDHPDRWTGVVDENAARRK